MESTMGILAIIGCIFFPLISVILIVWFKSSENRKRYQFQADLYAKVIEQGKPVPTDLFAVPQTKRYSLNAGLICMAAGIGIALAVWLMSVITTAGLSSADTLLGFGPLLEMGSLLKSKQILAFASLGIIPFLIGVAFIIIHFVEKEQRNDENPQ